MAPTHAAHAHSSVKDAEDDVRAQRALIRARRMRYLKLHPEYFESADREIADPLMYDRLVRRFMTSEEKGKQSTSRGFAGALEASIVRSEAKLHAANNPEVDQPIVYVQQKDGTVQGLERDEEDRATSREDGLERWSALVMERFLAGQDEDFEYFEVDHSEVYDDHAELDQGQLEQYVDREEAQYVGVGCPQGETGIQDF